MDPVIDVALDIIESMYLTEDVFWSVFDHGLDPKPLEEYGILINGRIAIEKDEIDKARHESISKAWYEEE